MELFGLKRAENTGFQKKIERRIFRFNRKILTYMSDLVIVESPAKAKTIKNTLAEIMRL